MLYLFPSRGNGHFFGFPAFLCINSLNMPNQYSREALTILMDDLPGTEHMLIPKQAGFEKAVTAGMANRYENFDIIPELEKAAIHNVPLVEEKKLSLQFHLSTSPVIVHLDRVFVQALLLKLVTDLLDTARQGSAIHIYVTDNDEKCIIESINQGGIINRQASDGYFKKYRITNPLQNGSAQTENVLPFTNTWWKIWEVNRCIRSQKKKEIILG